MIWYNVWRGEASPTRPKSGAEEEVDIDLNDPDVEAAAIKIQASFKGFQTRKTMVCGVACQWLDKLILYTKKMAV